MTRSGYVLPERLKGFIGAALPETLEQDLRAEIFEQLQQIDRIRDDGTDDLFLCSLGLVRSLSVANFGRTPGSCHENRSLTPS